MTRYEGERERVLQHLARLREMVDQATYDLQRYPQLPPGPDVAQAIAFCGVDVARSLSALSAFDLVARLGPET